MTKTGSKSKRGFFRWWYLIFLILPLVWWRLKAGQGQVLGIKVMVEEAQKRDVIESVSASGKIFPAVEVEISSNISGTLVDLPIKEGDEVKEGQFLARVDPDALVSMVERAEAASNTARAQLESVRAQKLQLEAQFVNTEIVYQRTKKLYEEGVVPKAELDLAKANYEAAKANIQTLSQNIEAAAFTVKSSDATVREQRKNLSLTNTYAPMSGLVTKLYKKRGEQVVGTAQMAGTPILKIANLNSIEVRVDVNERDILAVHLGDTADVELDAYPGKKFLGIVTQMANTASNLSALSLTSDQVTNFEVRILLLASSYSDMMGPKGESPFRAGLSASVRIRTNALKNILTVPAGAVIAREDQENKNKVAKGMDLPMQEYVFVQKGDSVELRKVKTGIQDNYYLQIIEGLESGETVIIGPYDALTKQLEAGTKIKVVTEEELYKVSK